MIPRHPLVLLALLPAALAGAAELRLPITADNSIAAFDSEQRQNAGHAPRIKLKGLENIILLGFDSAPLKGLVVEKAVLRLRGCDARLMVRKVGLSTVASAWHEGSGDGGEGKPGDSCFASPALGERTWAQPGSCFLDVVGGRGGTIWDQAYVEREADQWYAIPVAGRLLEACAAGLSHGLALSDDNGQTMNIHPDVVPDTNHSNNTFFAREQNSSAPVLIVDAAPAAAPATAALTVEVKPWQAGADLDSGGVEVAWPGPADAAEQARVIGYRLHTAAGGGEMTELPRWMHPAPVPAGERVRALLRRQPPGVALAVEVEVIGRGGAVLARGRSSGRGSPALPAPQPLTAPPAPAPAAGAPPADGQGSVWAVPDLVKVNPVTGNVLEEPGVDYLAAAGAAGAWSQANPVWSGATSTVSLGALRNEWVAFQLECRNQREHGDWTITPGPLTGPGGARLPAGAVRLSRAWYQKVGAGERAWYADPLLPLGSGERFAIPDPRNAVPGQTGQTVYVELFVPRDAQPGAYTGTIAVGCGGAPLSVNVALAVDAAVIPDQAAFRFSMNAYSSPGAHYGAAGSDAFLAAERSFYVMGHEHRTTLAVLGYAHNAHFQDGVAWPLTGSGQAMKAADWSAWDRRYGPLFDGSAFAGTSRAGVPLDHFYLPFMESWPTAMAAGYKWNDATWEEHWKVAGPVEEGFSRQYREQWVAVMRDFIHHVAERGWRTSFQVYLNDKYFYKQYDPKRKRRGEGTSFWLLDEPQHIDDFSALAFFGRLIREAQQGDRTRVVFRADVSRPQWGRDLLDRLLDLNVSGGFAGFRPWLEDWRERRGQAVWTYGGAPPSTDSALGIESQALDLYARGVDGFVPWLTLGDERNWTAFEDTCVFYTGKPMGITGACASLRLKAYRRGEQDVEYVRLLAERLGLLAGDPDRRQVAALLAGAIGGTKKLGRLDAQGAVTESIHGLAVDDFVRLRRAVVARLR